MHITGNCDARFTPLQTFLFLGGATMERKNHEKWT